jgi:hypothetical protein
MASNNTKPAVGDGGFRQELVQRLVELPAVDNRPTTEKQVPRAAAPLTEAAIQRAIVQHYHLRAAPGVFMFAVPNGGYRPPVEAAIMRATGTVAGVPDTVWIKDGRAYFLELKAEGGRLSEAQERVLIALREAGALATHAHGLDQALRVLEAWGILRGAVS